MSNYSQSTFFTPKDSLSPGDPNKVIKGADFDPEFSAISTAVATKIDTAGDGLSISVTTLQYNIDALANVTPLGADEFVIADASDAGDPKALTLTALGTFLAGDGLGSASGVLALDLNELTTEASIASGDFIPMVDITDSGSGKITRANLNAGLVHDDLAGFVADEHVAHSGVSISAGTGISGGGTIAATRTISLDTSHTRNVSHDGVTLTAGVGLSGGGTIAANRTFNIDFSTLSAMTLLPQVADEFMYYDSDVSTVKTMSFNEVALPSTTDTNNRTFTSSDVGRIVYYTGTGGHTWTMNTGVGQNNCFIIAVNSGSGTVTLAGGTATLSSADSLLNLPPGGVACLIREADDQWFAGGALQ